ncbi:MAG: nucleotidyltransferase family protein [Paracoccaceae bacterium]
MSGDPNGLAILILAAGFGTRMRGPDKLLQQVQGQPVLRHLAIQALALGLPVLATLPRDGATARRVALGGLAVAIVEVADPGAGMAASLAAGIAALPRDCTGVLLVLGDMPEVTTTDMAALAQEFANSGGDTVVRAATATGVPGHPVVFPTRLFGVLAGLTGDRGARDVLATEQVQLVRLPGQHATLDLDTPEDWAQWRAKI